MLSASLYVIRVCDWAALCLRRRLPYSWRVAPQQSPLPLRASIYMAIWTLTFEF